MSWKTIRSALYLCLAVLVIVIMLTALLPDRW